MKNKGFSRVDREFIPACQVLLFIFEYVFKRGADLDPVCKVCNCNEASSGVIWYHGNQDSGLRAHDQENSMTMCFGPNEILLVELSNSGPYPLISVEVLGRPRIYAQPAPCINQYQCVPHGDALIVVPKSIHIRRGP